MTYAVTFGPVLIIGAMLYWYAAIVQAARRQLAPEQLATLENVNRIRIVEMALPIIPLVGAGIVTEQYPQFRFLPLTAGVLLAFVLLVLIQQRQFARTRDARLPEFYLNALKKGNLIILLMFASCIGFVFYTRLAKYVGS